MQKKIRFRKLIHWGMVEEGTMSPDAIIAYLWTPCMGKTVVLSEEEATAKGIDRVEHQIIQWKKYLLIDLWFIVIHIKWKTHLLESTTETTEQ